jgi:hypothetical protein
VQVTLPANVLVASLNNTVVFLSVIFVFPFVLFTAVGDAFRMFSKLTFAVN